MQSGIESRSAIIARGTQNSVLLGSIAPMPAFGGHHGVTAVRNLPNAARLLGMEPSWLAGFLAAVAPSGEAPEHADQ